MQLFYNFIRWIMNCVPLKRIWGISMHNSFSNEQSDGNGILIIIVENIHGKVDNMLVHIWLYRWIITDAGGEKARQSFTEIGISDHLWYWYGRLFWGAWNLVLKVPTAPYQYYSIPGFAGRLLPDGLYITIMRFGRYRFHILWSTRFEKSEDTGSGLRSNEDIWETKSSNITTVAYWNRVLSLSGTSW